MSRIKTRETVKNVKAIDKAAIAGERMKNAFIRSKNSTENLMNDRQITPSEYAEDEVMYAAEDISHDAVHLAGSGVRTATIKGKEALQRHRVEKAGEDLRQCGSETQPQAPTRTVPEQQQSATSGTHVPPAKQPVSTSEVRADYGSRTPQPVQHHPSQSESVSRGYQPISVESVTTLHSDADRRVGQGRQLAKKKAKQKAETGRQIKQQPDKIPYSAERTVKTADASSSIRPNGESIHVAERPVQSIGRSTQRVKSPARNVEQSACTIKQTAKSTGRATAKNAKGTIKTSRRAVKTVQQTSKAAIKTAQVTAKTAQKTAQATAKAARATAKAVAKATAAVVKAIIAGTKSIVAAIAAGGWVAVLVIVIICLIALIVGSCFGIFFSSEDTGSDQTMHEVVREINADYDDQMERIKLSHSYDELEISGSRTAWEEVLAVYAVKTTTDPDNAQEVASMDDGKKALLKEIFWAMNVISARTDTSQTTEYMDTVDGSGNIVQVLTTVTKTVLCITASHKTAEEMAVEYNFTVDQWKQLTLLLDKANDNLWRLLQLNH